MILFREERSPPFLGFCFPGCPSSEFLRLERLQKWNMMAAYRHFGKKEVPIKTARLKEWTYEEFMALPIGDPIHYEINDGDLCMPTSSVPLSRLQEF